MPMTIHTNGRGTPIHLVERDNGGVFISQGTSQLRLSRHEIDKLVELLQITTTPATARLLHYSTE
jgi:hypothetical protein